MNIYRCFTFFGILEHEILDRQYDLAVNMKKIVGFRHTINELSKRQESQRYVFAKR